MENIISIIKKLPEMESFAPVNNETIKIVEEKLNVKFAEDYKEYLLTFGAVCSDIIGISGICDESYMNVLDLTLDAKSVNEQVPQNFYVIEDVGVDGLVIWQDETGAIYQSIPNRPPENIYNTLSEYLEYVLNNE